MTPRILPFVLLSGFCLLSQTLRAADEPGLIEKLNWLKGPAKASMQHLAEIEVPAGYAFVDGEGARVLMEAMGNLTSGSELGLFAPTNLQWFVLFRFSADGYVKDDEKDKLDADAMLKAIQKSAKAGNEERKRRGYPILNIIGWQKEPAYDSATHNLEWAIRGESEGEEFVNYNTRILGRKGVMEAQLVVEPEKLAATLPEFKTVLATYNYKEGERYAEYRPGDKLAKYGLTALVLGGAAAGAAKLGLFAWLAVFFKKAWKFIILGLVAVAAFFKNLIFGRSARRTVDAGSESQHG